MTTSSTPESAKPSNKLPKDIAAEQGKVNVQINGTWHLFPRGMRLADACASVGVHVPCFCYHPKLAVAGSCRMCLVEQGMPPRPAPGQVAQYGDDGYQAIQWMPRAIIACANTVAENMGIRTESDLVKSVRKGVLEFLLSSHPLDCPICDKAGECRLQAFAYDFGPLEGRYAEDRTKKGKQLPLCDKITLDQERCVLCGRCIRFMRDIMKDPVLTMANRGTHNAVSIYPGMELNNNYSLNITDLCPVGALTSNDFRFKMRVWFLKETPSIDVSCGTGSNIIIWSKDNVVYRITPRRNDAVNSDWMPDSHRLNYKYIAAPERLTAPLIKSDVGAEHRGVAWTPALESIASALARVEATATAIVASASMTNEELYMVRVLADALGVKQFDIVSRMGEGDGRLIAADKNPNTTGASLMLGKETAGSGLAEIVQAVKSGKIKAVLALGEDLTVPEVGLTPEELGKLDYLVALAHTASPTTVAADVVLAGATWAEKNGTMINVAGRLQRINRAVLPPREARDDVRVLQELCVLAGRADVAEPEWNGALAVLQNQIVTTVPAFCQVSWDKIGAAGMSVIDTGVVIPKI